MPEPISATTVTPQPDRLAFVEVGVAGLVGQL
jgi:hypothetical protein